MLKEYSVINNIKLAVRLQDCDNKSVNNRAFEALKKVGLQNYADRKINTLSGGQQQRVAIARALAKDSKIILCDEPTGNLDSKTAIEIMQILKEIAKERLVIIVTHDEESIKDLADRIIRLKDGQVIEDINKTEYHNASVNASKQHDERKYNGLVLQDALIMIKDNIFNSIIINLIIIILLTSVFALTVVFTSLSQYNSHNAFFNTLKANDQYVIQITKYIDQPISKSILGTDQIEVVHGPEIYYEEVKKEDITLLKDQVHNKADFYPSYFFNKNLQDFTDNFIYTDKTTFLYEQISFREIVEVYNFSNFHLPLRLGNLPKENNEVLIYDYMAYNLLYYNVFNGDFNSVVGKN